MLAGQLRLGAQLRGRARLWFVCREAQGRREDTFRYGISAQGSAQGAGEFKHAGGSHSGMSENRMRTHAALAHTAENTRRQDLPALTQLACHEGFKLWVQVCQLGGVGPRVAQAGAQDGHQRLKPGGGKGGDGREV